MTAPDRVRVYLGLGSNMGDRVQTLEKAILRIAERIGPCLKHSPIYTTAPLNPPELKVSSQPDFLNACICIETALAPEQLLDEILTIEKLLGRDREHELRWGPRAIDIDILLYGHQVIRTPRLHVPHKHLADRDFVLVPLADIAPDLCHPLAGQTITELLIDHTERGKECFVTGLFAGSLANLQSN